MASPGEGSAPAWGLEAFEATGGFLGEDGRFRVAVGAEGLRLSAAEAAAVESLKAAARACGEAGGPESLAAAWALLVCEGLVLLCAHLECEVAGAALDSAGATGEMCASLLAYDALPGTHKPHAGEACYAPGLLAAAARRARFEEGRYVFHPRGFPQEKGDSKASKALGAWEPHTPEPDWPARLVRLMATGLVEELPEPGGPVVGTEARLEVVAWALRLAPDPIRAILALARAAARPHSLLYSREPLPLGYKTLVEFIFGLDFRLQFLRLGVVAVFADALARGTPSPERLAARAHVLTEALSKKEALLASAR
jgi:hypothetical protein